ncbi:MAG: metalloregulator ArsR/SmtB family transcription factor [Syntrophomonadaceae bacterium]|nr:metalloregulator ArsR/SmtB family transcription factor [Syntrophomonadaceae bacterium]MDD3024140.1 metalloregulator ArsR/SmtB family transcription factor [Syntrophomonadaceae bacterium]
MDKTKIAQALSDPIRYKILMMLIRGDSACCPISSNINLDAHTGLCNCEIMNELGMIQSRVSYHMKELVETGLVNEEPRGKWKYYFANSNKIADYIEQLKQDFKL